MRNNRRTGWLLALAVAALAGLAVAASGGDKAPQAGAAVGERATPPAPHEDGRASTEDAAEGRPPAGAAGLRVRLDPVTGRLLQHESDPDAAPPARHPGDRFSSYGGDLLEEPLPGGGFKVDLRGRFQSSVVAEIDPETDEVTIDCVEAPAGGEVSDED